MCNRATSIPRRLRASCSFQRMAIHAALFLVAATVIGAAPTKEAVIASYKDKFEYLKTWKIEYESDLKEVMPDGKKLEQRVLIVHGAKDKRAFVREKGISSTESKFSTYNSKCVCDGNYYKRLDWWVENNKLKTSSLGTIKKLSATEIMSESCVEPLGRLGLMNQRWEDHWWLSPRAAYCDFTVAVRNKNARIRPDSVQMDGYECYILETGQAGRPASRCWMASKLGFAIIRKEDYQYSQSGESKPIFTMTASEFSEKAPDLFLPTRIRILGGSDQEFSIHSVELNPDLPEDLFELDFPDGTWVSDKIRGRTYAVPELQTTAASVLNSVATGLHSLVQGMTSNNVKAQQPNSSAKATFWQSRILFALVCFTIAVLVVVGATLIRVRRKRRSYREPIG